MECDTFRDRDGDCAGEGVHPIEDPWGHAHMHLCDNCKRRLDNYEPDDDGECFRGGEAAAFENEQMARILYERRK